MRTIFKCVNLLAMSLLIANCVPSAKTESPEVPKLNLPDINIGDIDKFLESIKACDNKTFEVSEEAQKNEMIVKDKIESQDFESTDCAGNTAKGHAPIRDMDQRINIEAPQEFPTPVTYIRVENPRTCSTHTFDTVEKMGPIEIAMPDGTIEVVDIKFKTQADRKGNILLGLTDETYKFNQAANVKDGANLLKISYFGQCMKAREKADPKIKSAYYQCEKAELLGTKEVLVTVEVERPVIPGVRKVSTCSNK